MDIIKLAKKCNIPTERARDIIVTHHFLNNVIPPKDLVTMEIDVDKKTLAALTKISKILKVSVESVVVTVLDAELEKYRT